MSDKDIEFMKIALSAAKEAAERGEVPVGAVIVRYGTDIISVESNLRETGKNALYHAEVRAIDAACKKLGGWRLPQCTMYVTLEPCPMCAGAVINSRIDRVVFGAYDKRAGAMGSVFDINSFGLNHICEVEGGVLEEESAALLREFFKKKREGAK
ncbi:MAG: nucleoside deaminase [Clostridia bacterium]|nr:nucleoside deaminase [Clostridia bacterium]